MAKSRTKRDEEEIQDIDATSAADGESVDDAVRDEASGDVEVTDDVEAVIRALEQERDDAIEGRLRALADYKNFQRRSQENEARALINGSTRVVRELLPVLDNFDLALQNDPDAVTSEQILSGMRLVRRELTAALSAFKVEVIRPEEGDEFDPNRHEAIVRQPTDAVAPNSVLSTYRPGYVIGDAVLRPAQVIVAAALEPGDEEG